MSPMGLVITATLAHQGARIILLVPDVRAEAVVQMVMLLRESTKSENIFAESCDMRNLHSIDQFAQRWHAGSLVTGKAEPTSKEAKLSASLPGLPKQEPHRLDVLVFLPDTDVRNSIGASGDDVYMREVLARFHFVNAMLPSLLTLPPSRDIRIVSAVSPWYAAGLAQFNKVQKPASFAVWEPWTRMGAASLHWLLLATELQRRLDLLAEADPRSRSRLPDLDSGHTPAPGQHTSRRSHISSVLICPGFELPSQLTTFFHTAGLSRVHVIFLWVIWLILYPLLWTLGKPTSRAAEAIVWGISAHLESEARTLKRRRFAEAKAQGASLSWTDEDEKLIWQWPGLEPGHLYREGRLVQPPVPPAYRNATAVRQLWTDTEKQVKACLADMPKPQQEGPAEMQSSAST